MASLEAWLYQPAALERMLDSSSGVSIHGCLMEDMAVQPIFFVSITVDRSIRTILLWKCRWDPNSVIAKHVWLSMNVLAPVSRDVDILGSWRKYRHLRSRSIRTSVDHSTPQDIITPYDNDDNIQDFFRRSFGENVNGVGQDTLLIGIDQWDSYNWGSGFALFWNDLMRRWFLQLERSQDRIKSSLYPGSLVGPIGAHPIDSHLFHAVCLPSTYLVSDFVSTKDWCQEPLKIRVIFPLLKWGWIGWLCGLTRKVGTFFTTYTRHQPLTNTRKEVAARVIIYNHTDDT